MGRVTVFRDRQITRIEQDREIRRITVVYNPVKVHRRELERHIERHARPGDRITWSETNIEDPGFAQADRAVEEDADVVIAAGGDGTVRMVALALSGSDTQMAIVPGGTGNLLARNLGIPLLASSAVRCALEGDSRTIDLCRAELTYPDGSTEHSGFAVMAGVGVDAGMIHHTDEELKRIIGPAAYVPAVLRSLGGGNRIGVELSLDDDPPAPNAIHTCIVGNCGTLIAGMPLIPDAEIDDGLIDAVLLRPESVAEWGTIGAKLVADSARRTINRDPTPTPDSISYLQGRRISLEFDEPEAIELDGDSAGEVLGASIEVIPGTLHVVC